MKLTTTLNLIKSHPPCARGWKTLLTACGTDFDRDAAINLLTILDSNEVEDMLWCLRATREDSTEIARQLAIAFAEQALPIYETYAPDDTRPRDAIQAARDFIAGKITREEVTASRRYAGAAAGAAAYADADAASDAANAANAANAADAAARDMQVGVIRSILEVA